MTDTNRHHEIDRLRLLLQKATGARKALIVELQPSSQGFQLIVTGITAEHEALAAQQIADYLNILLRGAMRFTLAALEPHSGAGWKADSDGVLVATVSALASTPDALSPVPEEPASINAVDPVLTDSISGPRATKESDVLSVGAPREPHE